MLKLLGLARVAGCVIKRGRNATHGFRHNWFAVVVAAKRRVRPHVIHPKAPEVSHSLVTETMVDRLRLDFLKDLHRK